jgi:type II secretory pathway component GspD/PulD (secretin)
MKIKPEISSVTDFLITPSTNKIPIVDSSLAETTVMVKDGVSIIIGGLSRDEKVKNESKVPFLGDIPILGKPFQSKNETTLHTELLILLTPHIVYGDKLVEPGAESAPKPSGEPPMMSYTDYNSMADLPKNDPSTGSLPSPTKVTK